MNQEAGASNYLVDGHTLRRPGQQAVATKLEVSCLSLGIFSQAKQTLEIYFTIFEKHLVRHKATVVFQDLMLVCHME